MAIASSDHAEENFKVWVMQRSIIAGSGHAKEDYNRSGHAQEEYSRFWSYRGRL
jgi:hypothetical protein